MRIFVIFYIIGERKIELDIVVRNCLIVIVKELHTLGDGCADHTENRIHEVV